MPFPTICHCSVFGSVEKRFYSYQHPSRAAICILLLLLKDVAFWMTIMVVQRCPPFTQESNWWFNNRCILLTTRRAFDVSTVRFIRSERETIYQNLFRTIKGNRCYWLEQYVLTTAVYFRYMRKRRKPSIFKCQRNNLKNFRDPLRTQNKYNKMGRMKVNMLLSETSALRQRHWWRGGGETLDRSRS